LVLGVSAATRILPDPPVFADWYAFQPIVQAIAQESAAYNGKRYLRNETATPTTRTSP